MTLRVINIGPRRSHEASQNHINPEIKTKTPWPTPTQTTCDAKLISISNTGLQTRTVTHCRPRLTPERKTSSPRSPYQIDVPEPTDEDPPDQVKAVYTTDLSIIRIHEAIASRYAALRGRIPQFKCLVQELESKLDMTYYSIVEKNEFKSKIAALNQDIAGLASGTDWLVYIEAAKPIIDAYIPLSSDESKGIVTISNKKNKVEDKESTERRLELIQQYLDIARQYIRLDISWQGASISKCPGCERNFSELHVDEECGTHLCTNCGYERDALSKSSSYKDSSRVTIGNRNNYEDRDTFYKALLRYEGRQGDKIPSELYSQLDDYFNRKGFPVGEVIRGLPLLPNGKKAGTSTNLLIRGLSGTNNASFYSNLGVISHHYWGWRLPDLSEVRDLVMEDYDATQKVYEMVRERDSSLNVNIRLYLQLKARDFPCDWSDFKILTSRDSLEYHQRMWKIMCSRTKVKYTDII